MAMCRGSILRAASFLNPARSDVQRAVLCRGYAKAAEETRDIVKEKFIEKIETFYKLLSEFKKFRIVIDPDDPKVVQEFSDNIQKARRNVGLPPAEERLKFLYSGLRKKSKSVRDFYLRLGRFQAAKGEEDIEGNKAMLAAIDNVEKKIGKTLVFEDAKGMELFKDESAAALKKLDTDPDQLPQYIKQANVNMAKNLLQAMKKNALDTVEKYTKSGQRPDINVKELDPRNFIRLPGESKPTAAA